MCASGPEEPDTVFSSAFVRRRTSLSLNGLSVTVSKGHGVASGKTRDRRFPEGTLALQIPLFKKLGLSLESYFRGTLNLDLGGHSFCLKEPTYCFAEVEWSPIMPPENFSFYACRLRWKDLHAEALVYWPHPSTKPEFHQAPNVLEILAPELRGISYGDRLDLEAEPRIMVFE